MPDENGFATEQELNILTGILYGIVNIKNSKIYIGISTRSFYDRYQNWKNVSKDISNRYFKRAIEKYGIENFKIIIFDFNKNIEELTILEKSFIRLFNSNKKEYGYNLTIGGERPAKRTWQDFIYDAHAVHNDKYEYPEPINEPYTHKKVKIFCKNCNKTFYQQIMMHLCGQGCKKCSRILSNEEKEIRKNLFIIEAVKIHKNKYSYDKFEYKSVTEKGVIHCNQCDFNFYQSPSSHKNGHGCPNCAFKENSQKKIIDVKQFKERLINKHGNRFIFNELNYKSLKDSLDFACLLCGAIINTTPEALLANKNYCCIPIKRTPYEERIPQNEIQKAISEKFGKNYILKEFKQFTKSALIYCELCWDNFKISSPRDLLRRKSGMCKCCIEVKTEDFSKQFYYRPEKCKTKTVNIIEPLNEGSAGLKPVQTVANELLVTAQVDAKTNP